MEKSINQAVLPSNSPAAGSWKGTLGIYRELSKSGIVALVVISVLFGFLVGQTPEAPFPFLRLLLTLIGVLLLASGSSALNQLQERHIDALMPRTAKRPLPSGKISARTAWIFVTGAICAGLAILAPLSWPVFWMGVAAVISYNGLYTLWWKKHWAYAAVPGAIPGALPILMGFVSANGNPWHPAGIYLFLILFYWQMPHFWVLALKFRKDYALGNFPTLPVAKGEGVTVFQIALWCLAYVALALVAPLFIRIGSLYLMVALPVCVWLLWELRGFVRNSGAIEGKGWLRFFLGVTFSLVFFLAAVALDLWSVNLLTPYWTR